MGRFLLLIAAMVWAQAFAHAQPDTAAQFSDVQVSDSDAVTDEALEALKYERCNDALNLMLDYEREHSALSAIQQQIKAEAFACLGSLKTAIDLYCDLLRDFPDNTLYLQRRARLYGAAKQWKKALRDCRALQRLLPADTALCLRCGEYALNAERYDEAEAFLRNAPHLQHRANAQRLLALACMGQKKYSQGLLAINRCIALMPADAAPRLVRAQLYERSNMPTFAVADYQAYLTAYPADHQCRLHYALLLRSMGRTAEACIALKQAQADGNLDAGKYLSGTCK